MWNPFKKTIDWSRRLFGISQRELREKSFAYGSFEHLTKLGRISWRRNDHLLMIEEEQALSFMMTGRKGFRNILDMLAEWQNYKLLQEAYERHSINVETKAVREAKKQYANLTKNDIDRIRKNARDNMEQIDHDKLDYVKEFDIFVIRAFAPSAADATESNGQLLALGHYDGKHLEMAMYDDIKHNLQKEE